MTKTMDSALTGKNPRLILHKFGTFAGTSHFANAIPWVALVILLVGLAWGFVLKFSNPAAYNNIGHMVNES